MSKQQGKNFKYNKEKYKLNFKSSMCEGMENIQSTNSESQLNADTNADTDIVKNLKNEFSQTLLKYKNSYKKNLQNKTVKDIDISHLPYRKNGAVTSYADENYYITDRYVMKKIPKEGDMKENWECPDPSINISEKQKKKLTMGQPLKRNKGPDGSYIYQTCNDTHINNGAIQITDDITKNRGWLNDLGVLHEFKDPQAPPTGCNKVQHEIPSIKYNMFKKGGKLGPNDLCTYETFKGMEGFSGKIIEGCGSGIPGVMGGGNHEVQTQDSSSEQRVEELNEDLMGKIQSLYGSYVEVQDEVASDNTVAEGKAADIETEISKLEQKRQDISSLKKEITSLDGNIRDSQYLVDSTNMKYIAWGVSLTTIILMILFLKK
jgi:hypothetical protein